MIIKGHYGNKNIVIKLTSRSNILKQPSPVAGKEKRKLMFLSIKKHDIKNFKSGLPLSFTLKLGSLTLQIFLFKKYNKVHMKWLIVHTNGCDI